MAPESVNAVDPYILVVRFSALTCTTCLARLPQSSPVRVRGPVQVSVCAQMFKQCETPLQRLMGWDVQSTMRWFSHWHGVLWHGFQQKLSRTLIQHQNRRTIAFSKVANSFSKANGVLAVRRRTDSTELSTMGDRVLHPQIFLDFRCPSVSP